MILSSVFCPKFVLVKKREMALMLSLVSNLNKIESGSNYKAGGEYIISKERHHTEAIFRWVCDYLMEKKYAVGAFKDVKQAVRRRYGVIAFYARIRCS